MSSFAPPVSGQVGAARLGPASRARLGAAVGLGRLAALGSRLAGRGSGASIRGQVMLRLAPHALAQLVGGRRVAMVSGTNGKTTTTHFLAAAVRQALGAEAGRLVHNADGANLHGGIASALSEHPYADVAILETDERVVADLIRLGRPEVLVLLNFSRDQLDRHHEIKGLGRSWRDALAAAGEDGPVVVANADEPLIVWAAQTARRVVWVDTATSWTQDASLCPQCGAPLARDQPHTGADGTHQQGGGWRCTGCDLAQPDADYRVQGTGVIGPDGQAYETALNVPGGFNVSNAACALAAAALLGVEPAAALAGMATVTSPAGRFGTATVAGTPTRLLLAKNPAGWAEALPLARHGTVVLAIDSAAADGRDVSWLWDVDYEQLAGRKVIATGPRAQDLAVRLSYAGVEHDTVPDLEQAVGQAGRERDRSAPNDDPDRTAAVDVVATYTPFQRLRKLGGL